jgi:hypothetical protein
MRVSEYFKLSVGQGEVDFVDVHIDRDVQLFFDPTAIRHAHGAFRDECVALLQSFFDHVVDLIRKGSHGKARALLNQLSEPSETHLGYAGRGSHGLGVGPDRARQLWEALRDSEAVKTGLLQDLEDTALLIPGIDVDIVSDITTNVIRGPLIRYTQAMAQTYGIDLAPGVASGPCWDSNAKRWVQQHVFLPLARKRRLVLVPKAFVRRGITYSAPDYYDNYILTFLMEEEYNKPGSALVHLLKDGRRRVYKKEIRKQYGSSKETILEVTLRQPDLLAEYRRDRRESPKPPLYSQGLVDYADYEPPDWNASLTALSSIPPGKDHADEYHDRIFGLLTALFSPHLVWPEKEVKIHGGRKRVDIVFANVATEGFFGWVAERYSAQHVFIECKNYSSDPRNPEVDQLAGRFSPRRGKLGFLVCRTIENRDLLLKRCRDTADDDRGYIIPLDDGDVTALVGLMRNGGEVPLAKELRDRFSTLVM